MRAASLAATAATGVLLSHSAQAEPPGDENDPPLRADAQLGFSRFEQQVKSEIGGARGERLVEQSELELGLTGSYRIFGPIAAGLFLRSDFGTRRAGRFTGFDDEGAAVVADETGGAYQELWLGPLLRASWRALFFEVGYAVYGARWDDARDDLPTADGEVDAALRTSPTVAWLFALGGGVPVADQWQLVFRAEYRIRYYDRRNGDALADDVVHGTQSITPLLGVAWTPEL